MRLNLSDVCGTIGEEEKRLGESPNILRDRAANGVPQPTFRGLDRKENGMTFCTQLLSNDPAHGRLPRAVNPLKRDETGEHSSWEEVRSTLNLVEAFAWRVRTTFL